MIDKLVGKTIKFSLFVQIITTLVSLDGLFIKIPKKDSILQEILAIEAFVQFIEGFFYVWVILALKDMKLMTPRRYIDWMITTPIMLLTTIVFMKYNENTNLPFTVKQFIEENKEDVIHIFVYNLRRSLFTESFYVLWLAPYYFFFNQWCS